MQGYKNQAYIDVLLYFINFVIFYYILLIFYYNFIDIYVIYKIWLNKHFAIQS